MKIAQISPLYESVPPHAYGGTERVVAYLTEALVKQGHAVTLFASGDSITSAKLVPIVDRALRLDQSCRDPLPAHFVLMDRVAKWAPEFDILHFHTDYLHFPIVRLLGIPNVTTLHGRLDLPDLPMLYRQFNRVPLISVSNAQRNPLTMANWRATVYHGLPEDLYRFHPRSGGYLAFLGRISPEKRPDRAIEIARRTGLPLKIAAKVDKVDEAYFNAEIKALLAQPNIEFIGEIGDREKEQFLGDARALLVPIDWPEPFGLVMIEAMACGTPVIAFRCGSVPELMRDGVTGFVVDSVEQAVLAVDRIDAIDRRACRREFERRFTADRMALDYVAAYQAVIDRDDMTLRAV